MTDLRPDGAGIRADAAGSPHTVSHYLVSLYGPLTDDARGGLSAAGLAVDGLTGGGTVAPGGARPPMNRTYVRVEAATGSTAVGAVQAAVAGRGAYGEFRAQPL